MLRAYVSVINDLNTDQRVHRTCLTLQKQGYNVTLIGRKLPDSANLEKRTYACKRMFLFFKKGPAFYLFFNIRLFLLLLTKKRGLLVANDLDTLLANYLISKIKDWPIVYDSHEYFTEVPELQDAPLKKKIWSALEKRIIPKLKYCITVNNSIARLYKEKYSTTFIVIRNLPLADKYSPLPKREDLDLPVDKDIIILQGSGINMHRGAEEAVEAMQNINNAILLIIGGGDVINTLKKNVATHSLDNKIKFIPKLPYEKLRDYTRNSTIGLSLDKDTNINYRYSLPNKLFDYIHCGVPVLGSNLPEVKNIIETYNVGQIINSHNPEEITNKINFMLSDKKQLMHWKENCTKAAAELNWDKEEKKLIDLINSIEK